MKGVFSEPSPSITGGGGMWVGVGTEETFGPGWTMKGLLYGGPGRELD